MLLGANYETHGVRSISHFISISVSQPRCAHKILTNAKSNPRGNVFPLPYHLDAVMHSRFNSRGRQLPGSRGNADPGPDKGGAAIPLCICGRGEQDVFKG